jgi:hypothetical protein
MRPLSLLFPASLLLLAPSTFAQTTPYPQPDTSPISTVQVTAPVKTLRIADDQAHALRGSYAMSNGWTLKVRPTSRFIDAAIDNEKPMRLRQLADDRFVSGDGNVTMEFNRGDAGDEMTMSYVPDQRLAQVVVISARVAQR